MNRINSKNSSNAVSNIKNITHLKLSVLLSSILLMLAFAFLSTQALTLRTLLPVLKNLFILIPILVRVLVRILILILILVITLVLMVLMGVLSKETVSLARKHFLYTVYRLMKKRYLYHSMPPGVLMIR